MPSPQLTPGKNPNDVNLYISQFTKTADDVGDDVDDIDGDDDGDDQQKRTRNDDSAEKTGKQKVLIP